MTALSIMETIRGRIATRYSTVGVSRVGRLRTPGRNGVSQQCTHQRIKGFREEGEADSCSLRQLNQAFERSNYSIQELLVALTQTDAFLYRPTTVQP